MHAFVAAALVAVAVAIAIAACASPQSRFDLLGQRDRLRYAACRHDVARRVCPDDPDCDIKAAELYAVEPPASRRRWLVDYGCPPDKIDHADDAVRRRERQSIGME